MRTDPLAAIIACVREANSSTLSEQVKSRLFARIIWRLANEGPLVSDRQTPFVPADIMTVRNRDDPS